MDTIRAMGLMKGWTTANALYTNGLNMKREVRGAWWWSTLTDLKRKMAATPRRVPAARSAWQTAEEILEQQMQVIGDGVSTS
eukprot:7144020-Heterocapsa_arctica.AAC.1